MAMAQLNSDATRVSIERWSARRRGGIGSKNLQGVPFAVPPIGQLRWREPQPVQHWSGSAQSRQVWSACYAIARIWRYEFSLQRYE